MIERRKKLRDIVSRLRATTPGQSSLVSSFHRPSRESAEGCEDAEEESTAHSWEMEKKTVHGRSYSHSLDRASIKNKGRNQVGDIVSAPPLPVLTCRPRVAVVATVKDIDCGNSEEKCALPLEVPESEPVVGYSALARKKKLSNSEGNVAVMTRKIYSAAGGIQSRAKKRIEMDWLPKIDEANGRMESDRSDGQVMSGMMDSEVSRIRDWLLSLGLCVLDREGNCNNYPLSSFGVCASKSGK